MSTGQEASIVLGVGFAMSKWSHLLHKMGFVDSLKQTTVFPKSATIFRFETVGTLMMPQGALQPNYDMKKDWDDSSTDIYPTIQYLRSLCW